MNETRENLLTRIINIYGFEHKITVSFAEMCEKYPQDSKVADEVFEEIVKCHEKCPQFEEDDE